LRRYHMRTTAFRVAFENIEWDQANKNMIPDVSN
jgi:hypothetical protein